MKGYSVAQIKRKLKGKKVEIMALPKPGSKVRDLFDTLNLYKGQVIDFGKSDKLLNTRIYYLKNAYGLDITHCGKSKWKFCGEYIGDRYISYVSGSE